MIWLEHIEWEERKRRAELFKAYKKKYYKILLFIEITGGLELIWCLKSLSAIRQNQWISKLVVGGTLLLQLLLWSFIEKQLFDYKKEYQDVNLRRIFALEFPSKEEQEAFEQEVSNGAVWTLINGRDHTEIKMYINFIIWHYAPYEQKHWGFCLNAKQYHVINIRKKRYFEVLQFSEYMSKRANKENWRYVVLFYDENMQGTGQPIILHDRSYKEQFIDLLRETAPWLIEHKRWKKSESYKQKT